MVWMSEFDVLPAVVDGHAEPLAHDPLEAAVIIRMSLRVVYGRPQLVLPATMPLLDEIFFGQGIADGGARLFDHRKPAFTAQRVRHLPDPVQISL
jgi:hypothetical protein